jgi:transposase
VPVEATFSSIIGIDIGSKFNEACHFVTGKGNGDPKITFREFNTFKDGNLDLAAWVRETGVPAVIMESTGVYWKSLHEELAKTGAKCIVANPRNSKNLPGRKLTRLTACGWLSSVAPGSSEPVSCPSRSLPP